MVQHHLEAAQSVSCVSVAPMMKWTDRHYRFLARLISQHTVLYTEMVTTGALLFGDPDRHLQHSSCEQPLVLQLGGHCPQAMADSARLAQQRGYREININVGCPSSRVTRGQMGVCLMRQPEQVADMVTAIRDATGLPVSIKTRIGIDHDDSEAFLWRFVEANHVAGVRHFIIHARKAWLHGLDPKENRTKPPLNYGRVYRLKQRFPDCLVSLNGGLVTAQQACEQLSKVNGVMIGRAAYQNPYILAHIDQLLQPGYQPPSRHRVVQHYLDYVRDERALGTPLAPLVRPLLGIFYSQPGGRRWRSMLAHILATSKDSLEHLRKAAATMQEQSV